ncbi:MAG: VCBS repeat-containing protein [Polyangiales bacterium]
MNADGYADFLVSATSGVDEARSGVVHLYYGRPRDQWIASVRPNATVTAASTYEYLGSTVAAADVNRDGRVDILAGAPGRESSAPTYQGSAVVWLANTSGGYLAPAARLPSNTLGGLHGQVVTAPGDVNGDGFCDVLVTAPMYPDRMFSLGQAHLWANQSSMFDRSVPTLTIQGTVTGGWLGRGATR